MKGLGPWHLNRLKMVGWDRTRRGDSTQKAFFNSLILSHLTPNAFEFAKPFWRQGAHVRYFYLLNFSTLLATSYRSFHFNIANFWQKWKWPSLVFSIFHTWVGLWETRKPKNFSSVWPVVAEIYLSKVFFLPQAWSWNFKKPQLFLVKIS